MHIRIASQSEAESKLDRVPSNCFGFTSPRLFADLGGEGTGLAMVICDRNIAKIVSKVEFARVTHCVAVHEMAHIVLDQIAESENDESSIIARYRTLRTEDPFHEDLYHGSNFVRTAIHLYFRALMIGLPLCPFTIDLSIPSYLACLQNEAFRKREWPMSTIVNSTPPISFRRKFQRILERYKRYEHHREAESSTC